VLPGVRWMLLEGLRCLMVPGGAYCGSRSRWRTAPLPGCPSGAWAPLCRPVTAGTPARSALPRPPGPVSIVSGRC